MHWQSCRRRVKPVSRRPWIFSCSHYTWLLREQLLRENWTAPLTFLWTINARASFFVWYAWFNYSMDGLWMFSLSAIVFGACNWVAIGIQFFSSTATVSEVSWLLASLISGSRHFQCENMAQTHAGSKSRTTKPFEDYLPGNSCLSRLPILYLTIGIFL